MTRNELEKEIIDYAGKAVFGRQAEAENLRGRILKAFDDLTAERDAARQETCECYELLHEVREVLGIPETVATVCGARGVMRDRTDYMAELARVRAESETLRTERNAARDANLGLIKERDEARRDADRLRICRDNLEVENDALKANIADRDRGRKALVAENAQLQEKNTQLRGRIANLHADVKRLEASEVALTDRLARMDEAFQSARRQAEREAVGHRAADNVLGIVRDTLETPHQADIIRHAKAVTTELKTLRESADPEAVRLLERDYRIVDELLSETRAALRTPVAEDIREHAKNLVAELECWCETAEELRKILLADEGQGILECASEVMGQLEMAEDWGRSLHAIGEIIGSGPDDNIVTHVRLIHDLATKYKPVGAVELQKLQEENERLKAESENRSANLQKMIRDRSDILNAIGKAVDAPSRPWNELPKIVADLKANPLISVSIIGEPEFQKLQEENQHLHCLVQQRSTERDDARGILARVREALKTPDGMSIVIQATATYEAGRTMHSILEAIRAAAEISPTTRVDDLPRIIGEMSRYSKLLRAISEVIGPAGKLPAFDDLPRLVADRRQRNEELQEMLCQSESLTNQALRDQYRLIQMVAERDAAIKIQGDMLRAGI